MGAEQPPLYGASMSLVSKQATIHVQSKHSYSVQFLIPLPALPIKSGVITEEVGSEILAVGLIGGPT